MVKDLGIVESAAKSRVNTHPVFSYLEVWYRGNSLMTLGVHYELHDFLNYVALILGIRKYHVETV